MMDAALERVLDLARWAPSGDNTQPWRLKVIAPRTVLLLGSDTRSHCVYDLDGRPSQIAHGAFIETAAIAASAEGWRLQVAKTAGSPETAPEYELHFVEDPELRPSDLLPAITTRSVQRLPLETRPLQPAVRQALADAVGPDHQILWLDGPQGRRKAAKLLWRSAELRLTLPEAYPTHRDVIEWNATESVDRVPDAALGVAPASRTVMRFALKSWRRVRFLNCYLAGTWLPRWEMDWRPALACACHFLLVGPRGTETLAAAVSAGRALQRLWLTAEVHGVRMQPTYTPLVFANFHRNGIRFSDAPGATAAAARIAAELSALWGTDPAQRAVFMGRLGEGPRARARSVRKPLLQLLQA